MEIHFKYPAAKMPPKSKYIKLRIMTVIFLDSGHYKPELQHNNYV
jgi:hypothetical protein